MSIELDKEWVIDNALIGNYNAMFPYLLLSIEKHTNLTAEEKRRFKKLLRKVHKSLRDKTCFRTFKEE